MIFGQIEGAVKVLEMIIAGPSKSCSRIVVRQFSRIVFPKILPFSLPPHFRLKKPNLRLALI